MRTLKFTSLLAQMSFVYVLICATCACSSKKSVILNIPIVVDNGINTGATGVNPVLNPTAAISVDTLTPAFVTELSVSELGPTGFKINWERGSDIGTNQANLQYRVVYTDANGVIDASSANSELPSGVSVLADWTKDLTNASLSNLSPSTQYKIAILVRDASGNVSVLGPKNITTNLAGAPTTGLTPSISQTTSSSAKLTWGAASDGVTPASNLRYRVLRASSAALIDSLDKVSSSLTSDVVEVAGWTSDLTSLDVSGLTSGGTSYFVIVVQDAEGKFAMYPPTPIQAATTAITLPVTPITAISNTAAATVTISWPAPTDSVTPSASLQYKLVKAASKTSIDSIIEAQAIGGDDVLMDWTASVSSKEVTGLRDDIPSYFVILVKDANGNISIYDPITYTPVAPAPTAAPGATATPTAAPGATATPTAAPGATVTPTVTPTATPVAAPTVAITSPTSGIYINAATNSAAYSVTGTCSGTSAVITIKVDGTSNGSGASCTGTFFSGSINTTAFSAGSHAIAATITNSGGTVTSTSIALTYDVTPPSIPSALIEGTVNSLTETPVLTFVGGNDAGSGLFKHQIRVVAANGTTEIKTWEDFTSGSKVLGLTLTQGLTYKVQLKAIDNAGNISAILTSTGWVASIISAVSVKDSCAVQNDGSLYCWGTNFYGEVGSNSSTSIIYKTPYKVFSNGASFVSGDTSRQNLASKTTCAIVSGALYCWGMNTYGQAGSVTPNAVLAPERVIDGGVLDVKVLRDKACAIVGVGRALQCWGYNYYGATGPSTYLDTSATPYEKIAAGVTSFGIGNQHVCSVQAGILQCWGENSYGQLGNGSTTLRIADPSTVANSATNNVVMTNVSAVSLGSQHTCALVNQLPLCWGRNNYGQLGDGTTVDRYVPADISTIKFSQIVARDSVTCAIAVAQSGISEGALYCWGFNSYGQVGNNTNTNQTTPAKIIDAGVTSVNISFYHACAVVSGALQCWGFNDYGQVSSDLVVLKLVPTQVVASGVTQVSADVSSTCAIINNVVKCFGSNTLGQLGLGIGGPRIVPTGISLGGGIPATINKEALCSVQTNGSLACWGENNSVGMSNTSLDSYYQFTPYQLVASGVATVTDKSYLHRCYITTAGALYCWGSNTYGQVGDNTTATKSSPVQVIPAGVTAVSVGLYHTCAIVNDDVQCWGKNTDYGQVGDGLGVNVLVPKTVIVSAVSATAVVAQRYQTCAIVDGALLCWGDNGWGQIGKNASGNVTTPYTTIASGVTKVKMSDQNTCALVGDALKCWGDTSYGQIGDGVASGSAYKIPYATIASGVSDVMMSQNNTIHACAVMTSGALNCWGKNAYGQVGNNSTSNVLSPTQVIASGVLSAGLGRYHSCAITTGNDLKCWGNNTTGELGDNSGVSKSVPTQILNSGVSAVSPGDSFTCAIVSGELQCWGYGMNGRLGASEQVVLTPTTVTFP